MAGSAKFARLIREKDYPQAAEIARRQIEDGATIIDINMDDAMLNGPEEMGTFLRYISNDPDIAKVPFMIDSSNWETILAGLHNCPGKGIVNSVSLKEGEEEFLRKASQIRALGAAIIVMAFDEQGQAVTFERKIEICSRASRYRKINDCKAHTVHTAKAYTERRYRMHTNTFRSMRASAQRAADNNPSVPCAAPHNICSRAGRRRQNSYTGRDIACTQRCFVFG